MSLWQYIGASLRQYRRVHLSVALGVALTTAVITGALLVGDSMQGSLRELALRGLGRIDAVVLAEHPFRVELGDELIADPAVADHYASAVPLLLTQGAASRSDGAGETRRATGLSIVGVTDAFWSLATAHPETPAESSPDSPSDRAPRVAVNRGNEIALTADIARELNAAVGDSVIVRIPLPGATPADSALGEKEDAVASRRLKVTAVLSPADADNMARFSLRPSQQAPRNVFVPLATLQDLVEATGQVNAVALATDSTDAAPTDGPDAIAAALRPQLGDYGLTVEEGPARDAAAASFVRISADRLVTPPHVVEVVTWKYGEAVQPVVTYLANTIVAGDRKIPYSTVAGVDSRAALGPVLDAAGAPVALADDEVALNDWAIDDLGAKVGDEITLTYYQPETTHGELREAAPLRLRLRAIVALADAEGRPTAAADPGFAPELPGVTDQDSIEAWELPFELVEEIRDQDEKYWDDHRTTPKAFVSHRLAARLWGTRWGTESVLRVNADSGANWQDVAAFLVETLRPSEMGMAVLPVKRQAIRAATGTTPFDGLFLGFSFFLMASALILTALLFRLGMEQRAREVGLLLATGLRPARVRRLFLLETLLVAGAGVLVGAALGVLYARLMVHGLNTWWVAATSEPFVQLHVTPMSIAIGIFAGLLMAGNTIAWSLRRFARLSARQLLAGDHQPPLARSHAGRWSKQWLPAACLVGAVALGLAAGTLEGEAQAGAFFGGGALALVGILAFVRGMLLDTAAAESPRSMALAGLALRNVRRNPSRTMMSLALAATASFLIVALSAFRLAPTERGTGGFDLLATADLPLHYDLGTPQGREQLRLTDEASDRLAACSIVSFRVQDGEDASCLNLYQTTQPGVLGAPPDLAALSRFQWAATATLDADGGDKSRANAWKLLDQDLGLDEHGRPVVPMVLDRNTALYSLKLYAVGDRLVIRDSLDREVTLQIVGMLANSVLQGEVLVSEANFLRLFPATAGRRYFLIQRGEGAPQASELAALLETELEDYGFDAVDARERLNQLMAVQNTYLSTFQSLGALGLLLGIVGMAIVQLRGIIERRGELALMQAAGFRRGRLARMVLGENLVLLAGGLGMGTAAALVAVIPQTAVQQVGAPWRTLALLLGLVALAGVAAAWLATRQALRAPLIPALRGD